MREDTFIYYIKKLIYGELDNKIKRLKEKYQSEWPEDYYITLSGVDFNHFRGQKNKIGDPTGNTAAHLVDLKHNQKINYEYYVEFKQVVTEVLNRLDPELLKIIKIYLKINNERKLTRSEKKKAIRTLDSIRTKFNNSRILGVEKIIDDLSFYQRSKGFNKAVSTYKNL